MYQYILFSSFNFKLPKYLTYTEKGLLLRLVPIENVTWLPDLESNFPRTVTVVFPSTGPNAGSSSFGTITGSYIKQEYMYINNFILY